MGPHHPICLIDMCAWFVDIVCELQCVAVCGSVRQCLAVCGSLKQCVSACCSAWPCVTVHGRVLQCVAV